MPNMYFGNELVRNRYAKRFKNAVGGGRLCSQLTRIVWSRKRVLWHDTYYDSTLPYWLLDRLHSTVGNLATETCQWWENGRFWAFEGCGCCHGTCGHVWNYEHALARLFPELERSVREMQDFAPGVGFIPETGEIRFRGENWGIWAGDSQGGYILKAYREHQLSQDDAFLKRNWPNIRKAVQFLIDQDGNADGLLEGQQHQTYDQNYFGPNTMVGSLYLGALRAAEEMARDTGDVQFADTCREIFEQGQENSVKQLFNGEYFIQKVDLTAASRLAVCRWLPGRSDVWPRLGASGEPGISLSPGDGAQVAGVDLEILLGARRGVAEREAQAGTLVCLSRRGGIVHLHLAQEQTSGAQVDSLSQRDLDRDRISGGQPHGLRRDVDRGAGDLPRDS